jgi:TRAP transporter 4TM/12TM fusion protein
MGAVVFLMVEFTGISYLSIIGSILISSIFYYVGIYMQVHLYSSRNQVGQIAKNLIPTWQQTLRSGWVFLLPMGLLVYIMLTGRTPALAATAGLLAVIISSWFLGGNAITPRRFVEGCVEVCSAIAPLIAAVAGAGILLITLNVTGLASKLSSLIFSVAEANLFAALLLAMIVTIVCGMGMPVVAVYSLVAIMVAPALVEAGLSILQAHLFLIFYAIASYITPPVAISSYVASTIANERPMAVSITAARIGIVVFILPFAFVYNPGLLMIGEWPNIALDVIKVFMGIFVLSVAIEGWYHGKLNWLLRGGLFFAGFMAFSVWLTAGFLALALAVGFLMTRYFLMRKKMPDLPI